VTKYRPTLHNDPEDQKPQIHCGKSSIQKHEDCFPRQFGLKCEKEASELYVWSIALYGAENWTLWKVDQKYLESLEAWCWRRMEKIIWAESVKNGEVLRSVKEESYTNKTKEG
jgi:hypothetical protein